MAKTPKKLRDRFQKAAAAKNGMKLIRLVSKYHDDLDEDAVHRLIDAGADVHVTNKAGETALMIAANRGHFTIVQRLVEEGADVLAKDLNGNTAYDSSGNHAVTEYLYDVTQKARLEATALLKVQKEKTIRDIAKTKIPVADDGQITTRRRKPFASFTKIQK